MFKIILVSAVVFLIVIFFAIKFVMNPKEDHDNKYGTNYPR